MSMNISRYLVATMLLVAATAADAKPRRVVVTDFDGPRSLADVGRTTVMSLLGDQYDVVATKRWENARAQATGHGPQQWSQAAKSVGVDAVIQGWITDEGRHHVLTITVLEAATGHEIDSVSVKLGDRGPTTEATHQLQANLEELLQWIDGDPTASESIRQLPDIRDQKPLLGSHVAREDRHDDRDRDRDYRDHDRDRDRVRDADDDDDDDDYVRRGHRSRHRPRYAERDRDDDRYDDAPPPPPPHSRRRDARQSPRLTNDQDQPADEAPPAPLPKDKPADDTTTAAQVQPKAAATVSALDTSQSEANELAKLFPPDTKEAIIVSGGKSVHKAFPTPRYMIGAGGYVSSRGMSFDYDPSGTSPPPDYPASDIKGLQINASVYPWPLKKIDGDLSGLGFTFGISRSVGATLTAMDDTGYGDYTLNHTAWELGIHYRYPLGEMITLDGEGNFGDVEHRIIDLPASIELPDTNYSYLGLGLHLDLAVTDSKATIGFGGRYMYIMSAGDVMDEDWYGAGTAGGYSLDASFLIPLPSSLYVRGGVEYRTVHLEFDGSGAVTMAHGVWGMDDTSISGSANVGIKF